MAPLRLCKDPGEITSMQKAVRICEAALEEVVSGLSPNTTEREIACRLSSALLLHGADSVPGEPQVLSGPAPRFHTAVRASATSFPASCCSSILSARSMVIMQTSLGHSS